MDFTFPENLQGVKEIIVKKKDSATSYGSGLIDVFATPAMVGLMEATANEILTAHLPEGYITLGIEIHVKHLKATPIGDKVHCQATLIEVSGKKLCFELEAHDSHGKIGSGVHWRYIVNAKDFIEKMNSQGT